MRGVARHWKPPGKNDRIRAARSGPWDVPQSHAPAKRLPEGAKAGLVLIAGACLGLVAGLYSALRPLEPVATGAEIEWNAVQAVPTRAPGVEDAAWLARADDGAEASAGGTAVMSPRTVRASFGYCKWGGGTNCVVDGDTFWIGGKKVRIAGIDAPETHPSRCDTEARLGNQATERLHALLNSGAVTMTGIDRDRDRYGRLLRNVAVGGRDVGEAMIAAGVAREYGHGRRPWC
jgi:endonuclease YncB( thermonuclease family)